jgi:hypothetical protein
MEENRQLNERLTDIIYHYTSNIKLLRILETDIIKPNRDSNENWQYVSFARNRNAGMGFPEIFETPVRITFDGQKLNSRFRSRAYDFYHENPKGARIKLDIMTNTDLLNKSSRIFNNTEFEDIIEVPTRTKNKYWNNGILNAHQYFTRIDIYPTTQVAVQTATFKKVTELGIENIVYVYDDLGEFKKQSNKCIPITYWVEKHNMKLTEDRPKIIEEIKCGKEDIISGRWRTMWEESVKDSKLEEYKSPQRQKKPEVLPKNGINPHVNSSKLQTTKNKNHSYTQCSSPSDPGSKESGWRSSKTPGSGSKYLDVDGVEGKYRYADHWHTITIRNFVPRQCPRFKNPDGTISFAIIIRQATNPVHVNNLTPSDKDWQKFRQLFSTYETELLWNNGATINIRAKEIILKIPENYDPGDSVPHQQLCNLLKKYRCAVQD